MNRVFSKRTISKLICPILLRNIPNWRFSSRSHQSAIIEFDEKGRLKKNTNEESLYESNDPFLLIRFETSEEVLDLLQRADFSFEQNDNIYFLERIYFLEKNRMGTTLITKDPRFKRLWEAVVSNLQYIRRNGGNSVATAFILFCY